MACDSRAGNQSLNVERVQNGGLEVAKRVVPIGLADLPAVHILIRGA